MPATASPASRNYFTHVWQTENGLPQNAVTAIVQTRDGYLWLGTYNGLARFDGVRFVVFADGSTPGLQSSRVTSLFEDADGILWIGHETGGLTRFKDGEFKAMEIRATWKGGKLNAIGADAAKDIWLVNEEGLLARLRDGLVLTPRAGTAPGIVSFAADRRGNLWIMRDGKVSTLRGGRLAPVDFDAGQADGYVQGMLARRDALVAISNSGETQELLQLLPFVKRLGIPVIAFTGRMTSTLAKNADVALDVSVQEEACPMGLAPTASTTATLALGDALAVALLQKREFKEEDFARFHPGGTLGRRLLVRVKDLMHAESEMPMVQATVGGMAAMLEMTAKKLGMTTVVDQEGLLVGVITDGDLRRFIQRGTDLLKTTAQELATTNPKSIGPDELAAKAVEMMERFSITTLVVTENERNIRGVIHLHDLLKNGIV